MAKFSFNKKAFDKFGKKFEKVLKETVNRNLFDGIGRMAAKQIKTRTRLGQGVDPITKKPRPLKPIEQSTKQNRKRYSSNLSSQTSPNTSNLTATGTLLNNINFQSGQNFVELFFKNKSARQLNSGRPGKIKLPRLANIHQNEGVGRKKTRRPFFSLADFEREMLNRFVRNKLRANLRKNKLL